MLDQNILGLKGLKADVMLINLKLVFVTQVMYANNVETKEKIKIIKDKKSTATYTVFIRLTALGVY